MEEFLGRDVGSRGQLISRGIASLVVLSLFAALATAYTKGVFADTITATAVFDDAGGSLMSGADVKASGVIVGKTRAVDLNGKDVRITLVLDRKKSAHVPAEAVARILPATTFGQSFLELVMPKRHTSASLRDGQEIKQDTSRETLELQTTLDSIYRVLSAVHPAELATTLAAVSSALKGRGDQIGASIDTLNAYLTQLNPHLPLVQQDLSLLAANLENLDRHAPQLLNAADDGLVTVRTIVAKKAELTSILTGGGALVANADHLLTTHEQPIVDTIRASAGLVDALYDERAGLASGFRAFVRFGKNGQTALGRGPWMDTDARIITTGGQVYTSADCPRYGSAQGDNCAGGAASGLVSASPPDLDAALVDQLKSMLADLDSGGQGGVGELLSRGLIGNQAGSGQ